MRLNRRLFVFVAFCFFVSLLALPQQVEATPEEYASFSGQTYDGGLEYTNHTYSNARGGSTATYMATSVFSVGQQYAATEYTVYHGYVFFDTSPIPDGATIVGGNLSIYVYQDYSTTDFNITIQSGMPYYPHSPLELTDYNKNFYSGNGGYVTTSGIAVGYKNISLSSTGIGWINKTGVTKFCLRSGRDIDGDTPSGNEYVNFYCAEQGTIYTPKLYVTYGFPYTFKGLLNEDTGVLFGVASRAVNVTAYYDDGTASETFEVNGTYIYNASSHPYYFVFELGGVDREYWLETDEDEVTIYVFNSTLTEYNVYFVDLAGVLDDYPYVLCQRQINGSYMTVDKRKVDETKKISFGCKANQKYNIVIQDGTSYTYGDVLFTSTTTVTLTLKAISFPKETLLTYKYVRVYAYREFGTPNGNITVYYDDTLNLTTYVAVYILFKNGTQVNYSLETSSSFSYTWTSAGNYTDYQVLLNIYHQRYGQYSWKQYLPQTVNATAALGLEWFGSLGSVATSAIIPSFLILFAGGIFSQINAHVGAFSMVIIAIVLAMLGFIVIPAATLIVAFALAVLVALIYSKRDIRY